MNRTELHDLGWRLVDQHRRVRDKSVLSDVFLMLGIGDYEHAITTILNYVADSAIRLHDDAMASITAWVDGYAGHEIPAALTAGVNRIATTGLKEAAMTLT